VSRVGDGVRLGEGEWVGDPGVGVDVVVQARRVVRGAWVRLGVVLGLAGLVGASWWVGSLLVWLAGHGPWAWAAFGALVASLATDGHLAVLELLASVRQVRGLVGCQRCRVVVGELAEAQREVTACEDARRWGWSAPAGH
jgi:hypothetical protein